MKRSFRLDLLIETLARAGEQAGISIEDIIRVLNADVENGVPA